MSPPRAGSSEVRFSVASRADDAALRRLLRETPMAGRVSVAFAREPSFFDASEVEGPVHQVIAATAPDGEVVGLCSRSVRPMWLNGQRRPVGYLSALRLHPRYRGRPRMLKEGFALVRRLHEAGGETEFYLSTIIEDNETARRVLERGLPGFPRYHARGALVTLALPTWRRRPAPEPPGLTLRAAAGWEELTEVLERNAPRAQFRPVWDAQNLALCRGLRPEDFLVAEQGGRAVGCAALWDQSAFKQSIVAGYAGALGRFRWLVNGLGPWIGVPHLPEPGQALNGAMLSHLAVDEDNWEIALSLVSNLHARAVGRFGTLTLGLPGDHPWTARIHRHFGAMEYRSVIYTVSFGAEPSLDERLTWPEVAVL